MVIGCGASPVQVIVSHAEQSGITITEMELNYSIAFLVAIMAMASSAQRSAFGWQSNLATNKPKRPDKPALCQSQCCSCSENLTEVQCISNAFCQDFTISFSNSTTRLPDQVETVKLDKFRRLKILRNSFSPFKRLRMILINNVQELETESNSFARSANQSLHLPTLDISKTAIKSLPKGSISAGDFIKITIANSTIDNIESGAFSDLPNLHSLIISSSNITTIESRAFNNSKCKHLKLDRNMIGDIEDEAFNISIVNEAVVNENQIGRDSQTGIKTASFNLSSPEVFRFSKNVVRNVYRHAFQFKSLKVEIMNNTFDQLLDHAFHYIEPANNQSPPFYFTDNVIKELNNEALFIHNINPTFHINFLHVKLSYSCNCTLRKRLNSLFQTPKLRIIDDVGSIANHILDAIYCSINKTSYEKFQNYETALCSSQSTNPSQQSQVSLPSILIPLFLAIIVLSVVIYFWKRIRERMDQISKRNWVIAVPQTVYKENEIRIAEECAFPIEELPEWQVGTDDYPDQAKTAKASN